MANIFGLLLLLVIIGILVKRDKKTTDESINTTDLLATAVALTNSLRTIKDIGAQAELSVDQRLGLKKAVLDIELERDKVLRRLRSAGVSELTIQQVVGVLT